MAFAHRLNDALDAELARRAASRQRDEARDEQSQYGWYDEDGVRQGGLMAFIRYFWHVLEPATRFVDGWPLWAMAEHLESVSAGRVKRLLLNVPPGSMKSLLVNVFWPAWEWGPMKRPHLRYLTFSYSAALTHRDNGRFRRLVASKEFQDLYDHVVLSNKTVEKVENASTGWKLASSVGGVGTGERGDRIILDDPHNVVEAESETERGNAVLFFRESLQSRFNNEDSAFVVIMQRVHEEDVSGAILTNRMGYCHLMVPMMFDYDRQTDEHGEPRATAIGWTDPRYHPDRNECDGVLAWEERFSESKCEELKNDLGPYAWAGQYQQAPAPRGGGIFRREWWQLWESPNNKLPPCDYIVASLDGAFTENEENDPSALTVWGVFKDPESKRRRIILMDAWAKRLQFSGPRIERLVEPAVIDGKRWPADAVTPGMPKEMIDFRNTLYKQRSMKSWGLIEHVADTCRRRDVDLLLIEAKASGISAAQELRNRYGLERWGIQLVQVRGDKVARAYAAVPTWSQLMVYAPDREWAQDVIDEMANFPKSRHDDLTDSTTQAINYLRSIGLAMTDDESRDAEVRAAMPRRRLSALYPV